MLSITSSTFLILSELLWIQLEAVTPVKVTFSITPNKKTIKQLLCFSQFTRHTTFAEQHRSDSRPATPREKLDNFDLSLCGFEQRWGQRRAVQRGVQCSWAHIYQWWQTAVCFALNERQHGSCCDFGYSDTFHIIWGICFSGSTQNVLKHDFNSEINKCVWIQSGLKHYNCEYLSSTIRRWIFSIFKRMWVFI